MGICEVHSNDFKKTDSLWAIVTVFLCRKAPVVCLPLVFSPLFMYYFYFDYQTCHIQLLCLLHVVDIECSLVIWSFPQQFGLSNVFLCVRTVFERDEMISVRLFSPFWERDTICKSSNSCCRHSKHYVVNVLYRNGDVYHSLEMRRHEEIFIWIKVASKKP